MGAPHAARVKGYEACSGCSLCLLVCPVWRATRDLRDTPHGMAKALQHGAAVADIASAVEACTLCGACEPACPENMALVAMITGLREQLLRQDAGRAEAVAAAVDVAAKIPAVSGTQAACRVVSGRTFVGHEDLLAVVAALLHESDRAGQCADAGADISLALEAGLPVSEARRAAFLDSLRGAQRLIVADGTLIRALRAWLPQVRMETLGAALSSTVAVRTRLHAGDLYVIEPRAYHTDQDRLVKYYDELRADFDMGMNLDLQRMAIPTTVGSWAPAASAGPKTHAGGTLASQGRGEVAPQGCGRVDPQEQARWIMEGRRFERIVVEDPREIAVFAALTDKPVLHLAQLG